MFSGEVPFSNIVDRILPRHVVDCKQRPARPSHLSLELPNSNAIWNLIQSCWVHEPVSRPSMSAIQRSLAQYTSKLSQNQDEYMGRHRVGPSKSANTSMEETSSQSKSKNQTDTDESMPPVQVTPIHAAHGVYQPQAQPGNLWPVNTDLQPMGSNSALDPNQSAEKSPFGLPPYSVSNTSSFGLLQGPPLVLPGAPRNPSSPAAIAHMKQPI